MKGMSIIVRTVAGIVYGFIIVFGLYVILHGHLTPGGGFQGGAIVASAFALLLVARGSKNVGELIRERNLSSMESIGAIGFIGLALLGLGITFFYNSLANSGGLFGNMVPFGANQGDLNSGGLIPLMNVSVGIKVLSGIGSIVVLMALGISVKKEVKAK